MRKPNNSERSTNARAHASVETEHRLSRSPHFGAAVNGDCSNPIGQRFQPEGAHADQLQNYFKECFDKIDEQCLRDRRAFGERNKMAASLSDRRVVLRRESKYSSLSQTRAPTPSGSNMVACQT